VAVDRRLLRRNLRLAPFQPATALWRTFETAHLLETNALPRAGRGLDLGCGDGGITELLRDALDARWRLTGIDPDRDELELAAARGLYERLEQADGASTGADESSFDFVFSNSVLEHIEELEPTLRETARVLAVEGTFVFTVPSSFFHENVGPPGLLGWLATGTRDPVEYRRAIDRRLAHLRYPSVDEWRAMLANVGLDVVHASLFMSRPETRRWVALSNATAGLLVRVSGKGASPIEVQRRLGLRRRQPPGWLRPLASALSELAVLGLSGHDDGRRRGSCLLVTAQKRRDAGPAR
jgi:SAM-dependent methyltransferase